MGTLYVIGAPTGEPGDLTRRASAILQRIVLVVADDEDMARQLLGANSLAVPLITALHDAHLAALADGDVALLCSGLSPAPSESALRLIRQVIAAGYSVVSVPGPSFPVTALVLSGLPADSFVYLGKLPLEQFARRELLAVVGAEHRSLLALAPAVPLSTVWADLQDTLGDRPLALVASSPQGAELVYRGSVAAGPDDLDRVKLSGTHVLIIGGAQDEAIRWEEERLRSEIQAGRDAGLGVKEISQQLAERSGWSRREIYQLSLELARPNRHDRKAFDAS